MNRNKKEFFDASGIFAENDVVILTAPKEDEIKDYVQVLKENSEDRAVYDDPGYAEHMWKELNRESGLYLSIIRKADGLFCGYCGMEDLEEDEWELSIELLKCHHRQGLGYKALDLMLTSLKEKAGVSVFKSRVEGLNLASQKLMEKAYGTLVGIEQEDGVQVLVYQHRV